MMGILSINSSISSTQQSHGALLLEIHCIVVEHDHHLDFQTLLGLDSLKTSLIPERLRLEKMASGDPLHLVQMPLLKQGHLQLVADDHVQLVFSISKDGDFTSCLGDLCQCLASQ